MISIPVRRRNPWKRAPSTVRAAIGGALGWAFLVHSPIAIQAADEGDGLPAGLINTKKHNEKPLAPAESARRMRVPEGFNVSLFAGEPDLHQPVDFDLDDRGRLWAVECFSYPDYTHSEQDRVVMFTDQDGDSRADHRQVFLANGRRLTSIALGFGGVWLLSLPELLFIPDRDGDGVPDGPAEVRLDGWSLNCVHNMVNGLAWGPDGWLYGRHGMHNISRVGRPGTADSERIPLDCSVWRYHPTRHVFEVVVRGMVNPWGLDWDENGQAFIGNNVNGHLWHLVPGAVYERTAGAGFNPYAYDTLPICADHLHFGGANWREGWIASRISTPERDRLGGGHSHCGAMIYLGDNWPDRYRGTIFQCNTHGRRVNNDYFERRGSGYVARHGQDFLDANDPWFRGTALKSGPDGGVFVSDWNDFGECHDHDGVFRSSGRVYKLTYGQPERVTDLDLARASDTRLIAYLGHRNEWFSRHARRLLQERAANSTLAAGTGGAIRSLLAESSDVPRRLRALWALHAIGGSDEPLLLRLLDDENEHVQWWAVQFLCENRHPSKATLARLEQLARSGTTPLTRLALASALQRLPVGDRWSVARALLGHAEDAADPNLPLMIWMGIEPAVAADTQRGADLIATCRLPQVRQFMARRITAVALNEVERPSRAMESLTTVLGPASDAIRSDILSGIRTGLEGYALFPAPANWDRIYARIQTSPAPAIREAARAVSVTFGGEAALQESRSILMDSDALMESRRAALDSLARRKDAQALDVFLSLTRSSGPLRVPSIQALRVFDDPRVAPAVLASFASFNRDERREAMSTLVARPQQVRALLTAIDSGKVSRQEITPPIARLIQGLKDPVFDRWLALNWGSVKATGDDLRKQIEGYLRVLGKDAVDRADAKVGSDLFQRLCAVCHMNPGQGSKIGPELRGHLDSLGELLSNVADPNAVVPKDFQQVFITTRDGQLQSGILAGEDGSSIRLKTLTEAVTIPLADIQVRETSSDSMMPEGLLRELTDAELRGLFRYLTQ